MSSLLPLKRIPHTLGVTFGTHFIFSPHIDSVISRASSLISIIKALARTNWGHQKDTILNIYRSIIWSLFNYPAPIRFPDASSTIFQKLQNTALRVATGCVKMTSIDHLPEETKVLPVHDHLSITCSQYLDRTLQSSNPSLIFQKHDTDAPIFFFIAPIIW